MDANYNEPSMDALAAILICLEHSFWHSQNGSSTATGFKMAWSFYVGAHQENVNRRLKQHFNLKRVNDWFGQHAPSRAECDAFTKIILQNRLTRPDPSI